MLLSSLTLKRIAMTPERTQGVLLSDNIPLCVTVERPWLNNAAFVSCIPPGKYIWKPHTGNKWMHVWELENVVNRHAILIHSGNTERDVEGCIAVGNTFFAKGVLQSQLALDNLRKILADHGEIEIINC